MGKIPTAINIIKENKNNYKPCMKCVTDFSLSPHR